MHRERKTGHGADPRVSTVETTTAYTLFVYSHEIESPSGGRDGGLAFSTEVVVEKQGTAGGGRLGRWLLVKMGK